MSIQVYETMFMLDPNKMAADADNIRDSLHNFLEKYGAEILISRSWDENHKLAYPIRKNGINHKRGWYHIIYYKMESTHQGQLDRDLRISTTDFLIRYFTALIHPKWVDAMLDVAQNDHHAGFALRGFQDDGNAGDMTPANINDPMMNDDHPGGPQGRRPGPRQHDDDMIDEE